MRKSVKPFGAPVAMLLFLCAACSARSASRPKTPEQSPLDQLLFGTDSERAALTKAREKAMSSCMTKDGFAWYAEARFQARTKNGYGVTETPPIAQQGPNERYVTTLTRESSEAYSQHFQICLAQSNDEVSASRPVSDRIPSLLAMKRKADQQVAANPKVVFALRKWASCMKASGWKFANPKDPQAELMDRFNTFDPSNQVGSPGGGQSVPADLTDPAISAAASIEDLRVLEKRIFIDDKACSIPLNKTYKKVRRLVEEQLLRSAPA